MGTSPGAWRAAAAMLFGILLAAAPGTAAPDLAGGKLALRLAEEDAPVLWAPDAPEQRRWFFMYSVVNVHPKLESERMLDQFLNRPLRAMAPGFKDVKTFGDLRDDFLMWPPHIAFGRVLSDHWAWFIQGGYSAGPRRTLSRDRTWIGLPLQTDLEIRRGAAYVGGGLDFYPFGMPEQRDYDGFADRLRNTRPILGGRLTWTRATYDAKVKIAMLPFPNFVNLKLGDEWSVLSVNLNAGFDMPLNERHVFNFNAGYTKFWEQDHDFSGPVFTVGWKYFLR